MRSNKVIVGDGAIYNILRGINTLANVVKVTLGPRGRNVIILNEEDKPYITKDGVSVAKSVNSDNPIEQIGITIAKEASEKTAKEVGDATTTSTILLQSILEKGLNAINSKVNVNHMLEGMKLAVDKTIDIIKKKASPISTDNMLKKIATISANNNEELGKIVYDAIKNAGTYGKIAIKPSNSIETSVSCSDGYIVDCSYLSSNFLDDYINNTIEYTDAFIYVSIKALNDVEFIKKLLIKAKDNNKPIVIFAPDYSAKVMDVILTNHIRKNVSALPLKLPGFGINKRVIAEDLSHYCNTPCNESNIIPDELQVINSIKCTPDNTTIICNEHSPKLNEYVSSLVQSVKEMQDEYYCSAVMKRASLLTTGTTIINVGAVTEVEMKEKYDRVEDAVCATRAAIKGGIIRGGGAMFVYCSNKLKPLAKSDNKDINLGVNIIIDTLKEPFFQLCVNSNYTPKKVDFETEMVDFKRCKVIKVNSTSILDPANALIASLNNAFSVASMLLSTNGIVY